MNRKILLMLLLLTFIQSEAQQIHDFQQVPRQFYPFISGDTSFFIWTSKGIESDGPKVSGTELLLQTDIDQPDSLIAEFSLTLDFATSGNNYLDVFMLTSDSGLDEGYRIRVGGSDDRIWLVNITEPQQELAGGPNDRLASNDNELVLGLEWGSSGFKLRTKYNAEQDWYDEALLSSLNYTDPIRRLAFVCRYTSSNADNFYFHSWKIGMDTTVPELLNYGLKEDSLLVLNWSEEVRPVGSVKFIKDPITIKAMEVVDRQYVLHLSHPIQPSLKDSFLFRIEGYEDLAGNQMKEYSGYVTNRRPRMPKQGELRITELHFLPRAGQAQFVELLNASDEWLSLSQVYLAEDGRAYEFPDTNLMPGQLLVFAEDPLQNTLAMDLPYLGRSGTIAIESPYEMLDALTYSEAQLMNEEGYSLELQDTAIQCSEPFNWSKSIDFGGSPGRYQQNPMDFGKETLRLHDSYPIDEHTLEWRFDAPLLSRQSDWKLFIGNRQYAIDSLYTTDPLNMKWRAGVKPKLPAKGIQQVKLMGVGACRQTASKYISRQALERGEFGLLFSELMAHPHDGQPEYIEIHHFGDTVIDLKDYRLQRLDEAGFVIHESDLAPEGYMVFPGDYLVLSESYVDKAGFSKSLLMDLPELVNSGCRLRLVNAGGQVLDEVHYTEDWHDPSLKDLKGIALERLRFDRTNSKNNWYSAGASHGYATPGAANSQRIRTSVGHWTLSSPTFSPDGDGFEDVLNLNYGSDNLGKRANIIIADMRGRIRYHWANSELLATEGSYSWQGYTNQGLLPAGNYLVRIEVFDDDGSEVIRLPLKIIYQ